MATVHPSAARNSPRKSTDARTLGHHYAASALETHFGKLNEFERKHAPEEFYFAGDVSLLDRRRPKVSIVGSREASEEGLRRAAKLAKQLVEANVIVVSGLARGIDAAAHMSAIQAGGHTIAVIGTPLNKVYPKEHAPLQERIAREHLVVSQFAPGRPVGRHNFPMRNRTMALIVDASVIIEAGDGSGTLSQGWEALRLNRALFLAKSVVDRPGLKWPHEMLDYGAHVLTDVDDLLACLPYGDPLDALSA